MNKGPCFKLTFRQLTILAGCVICGLILIVRAHAQAPSNPPAAGHAHTSSYAPSHFPKREHMYYEDVWGIDTLTVRAAESGELIRFHYRVLNAAKASPLNDKKAQPTLIDPRAGVSLVVPSLEKVGMLRQSSPPEEGKIYWMAFSNKGRRVKRGDRVNVVIGHFQANGLVVE